jgi:HemY protein
MIRVIAFLALLLALALGVAWIADRPGHVIINWLDNEYRLDILTAIIAFLVASIALAVSWSLLRLFFRLPSLMTMASRSRRKQKGYQAVSRGMVAVSAGDARAAQKHSTEAQKLLGHEPLTLLLGAQAAQLSGDGGKAETAFNTMLDNRDTRIVGLRGLYIEAQRKSDGKAARFYANEAYKLAPSADWASDAALAYRCQDRDWLGAMALVEQAASRRLIDKETARRQRAILLTADALDRSAREPDAAFRAAQEAVKLDPTLSPAAAFLGRKTSEKGEYARASKVLEAAWAAAPHPDVAEAYLDVRMGDSAQDRLKRARMLLKIAPRDPESRLVVARAALDAREFKTARETLETLVLEQPTVRACVLMAELEEADGGNMGMVREWLARASRAQRDKAWVADGRVSEAWAPISPVNGKLGGFVWTTPPQAPGSVLIDEIRAAPIMVEAASVVPSQPNPADVMEIAPSASPVALAMAPVPDDPGAETVAPAKKRGWFS